MTLTERNQKLYELRKKKAAAELELAWIEVAIMAVNAEYDREQRERSGEDLFAEMFGPDIN